jgi:hypothetical protein
VLRRYGLRPTRRRALGDRGESASRRPDGARAR